MLQNDFFGCKKDLHEALDNLRVDQVVTVHFISVQLFPKLERSANITVAKQGLIKKKLK